MKKSALNSILPAGGSLERGQRPCLCVRQWLVDGIRPGWSAVAYGFHMLASDVGGGERPVWHRFIYPVADADLEAFYGPALQNGLPYNEIEFDDGQLPEVCGLLRTRSLAALAL